MILKNKIYLEDLINNITKYYPDRIKFCIDIKRNIISIGEQMHHDMTIELEDDGSQPYDIFGGDIIIDDYPPNIDIIWEAYPNKRYNDHLFNNFGRKLMDENIKYKAFEILKYFIK